MDQPRKTQSDCLGPVPITQELPKALLGDDEHPSLRPRPSNCSLCRSQQQDQSNRVYYSMSGSLKEFRQAMAEGCPWCSLIIGCVDWAVESIDNVELSTIDYIYFLDGQIHLLVNKMHRSELVLDVLFCREDTWRSEQKQQIAIMSDRKYKRDRKALAGSTDSEQTLRWVKNWMKRCPCCPNYFHYRKSPTLDFPIRLIDVRGMDLLLIDNVQLNDGIRAKPYTWDELIIVQYTALSHCWGSRADFIQTRTDNIGAWKEHIPWEMLTKTFQHAIQICRRLDIPYIWIDCLAIIQDDEQDWKQQSSQMADIYENAFLTIAATGAVDGSIGLYRQTDKPFLTAPVRGHEGIFVRQRLPQIGKSSWIHEAESLWPLLQRGWEVQWSNKSFGITESAPGFNASYLKGTFQELYLSSHVLHFGAQEAIWSCREGSYSESGDHYPGMWHHPKSKDLKSVWYYDVADYSRRKLTYDLKDKLPAIAALAKRMQRLRGSEDEYMAGLWKSTMLFDLLWYCLNPPSEANTKHPGKPSWSWTSVGGHVKWGFDLLSSEARVLKNVTMLSARYMVEGPRNTGAIKEASLTIEGPLLKLADLSQLGGQHAPFDFRTDHLVHFGKIVELQWDLDIHVKQTPSDALILPISGYDLHITSLPGAATSELVTKRERPIHLCVPTGGSGRNHVLIIQMNKITGNYSRLGKAKISYDYKNGKCGSDHRTGQKKIQDILESLPTHTITLI